MMKNGTQGPVGRNALVMASGVALSRITGLLREQVFAWGFGAAGATEAFVAAMRIPNFLRDLLAENIASSAVVPVYTSVRERKGRAAAADFAASALGLFALLSTLASIAGILLAPWLVAVVTPGFASDPARFELTVLLTRWLFPFLALISVSAFLQAIQNAEGKFFMPAFSTAALNIGFIVVGWFLSFRANPPILGMAWGALAGGVIAILTLLPGYRRALGGVRLRAFRGVVEIRELLLLAAPLLLGVAATNINMLVNTVVASFAEKGAIAYLNYAYRVMHLPLGLIAVSLSTAALPSLAKHFAAGDEGSFSRTLGDALGHTLRLSLPAAVGLMLLREDIIGVLFNYGRFGAADNAATAAALLAYAAGVPAFSLNRVFASAFYGRKNSRTPVIIGGVGVGANILLNLAALFFGTGFLGIAFAASIAGWLQTILHFILLSRTLPEFPAREIRGALFSAAGGLLLMTAAIEASGFAGLETRIARLLLAGTLAGGAYYVAALRKRSSRA